MLAPLARARRVRGGLGALPLASGRPVAVVLRAGRRSSRSRPGTAARTRRSALPATASRQLLVPAALALAFAYVARAVGAALLALGRGGRARARASSTRPTRSSSGIPFAGFLVARSLVARRRGAADRRRARGARRPRRPRSSPGCCRSSATPPRVAPVGGRARGARSRHYAGQLDVFSDAQLPPRAGGVRPRAARSPSRRSCSCRSPALALRRRWAAFVLGGSLAVLARDARAAPLRAASRTLVSLSQSRRAAGFSRSRSRSPAALAVLAGAAARSSCCRSRCCAGIALQLAYPGDFGYRLEDGGPALVTWIAVVGGAAALVLGAALRRRPALERPGPLAALAAALFVLPGRRARASELERVATRGARARSRRGSSTALREQVPERRVVFSDLETSYRIAAYAPVYVAAAPPGHVADTKENRPYERRERRDALLRAPATSRSRAATAPAGSSSTARASTLRRSTLRAGATATRTRAIALRTRHSIEPVKLLLVSLYFPPAGGGGVQRPLKFAHAPARARDRDARARAGRPEVDPRGRRAARRRRRRGCTARATSGRRGASPRRSCTARTGLERALVHARLASRRLLVPDENVTLEPDRDPGGDPDRARARGSTSS